MKVKLNNVRMAFSALFTPTAFEEGAEPKYKAVLLIPKESPHVKEINAAILAAATEKWGVKAKANLDSVKNNPNKFCFTDGNLKEDYDGFPGHMALSTSSSKRPTVIDRDKSPLTAQDGRPYDGCYVNAVVDIWIQENKFGKGARCQLAGIQFSKDGDAFAGGASASPEEFEDIGEENGDLA